MVIQRWQSLLLLGAIILMVTVNFVPLCIIDNVKAAPSPLFTTDAPILLVLDLLICVMLAIGIFMYGNLRKQLKVLTLSVLLMFVLAISGAVVIYRQNPAEAVQWSGAVVEIFFAAVVTLVACAFIRRDRKLLASSDRLR